MIKNTLISVLALIALTAVFGCSKKVQEARQIPPSAIVLGDVVQKDVFSFIDTLGTVNSFKSVKVVPQVTGQIVKINFKQGEYVKEGDILAEIDKRKYSANVLAAQAQVQMAKSQLKIDTLDMQRNKKLAEQNFVSKQNYDALVAKVQSDEALLKNAKAELELAKINLQWCDVRAPISGKVGFFNIDLGNIVTANSPTSMITTIEETHKLYVDFFIPSAKQFDVQNAMKNSEGGLELDVSYVSGKNAQKYSAKARVEAVENRSRYASSTLVLRAVLDNKDLLFWPDQSVKVILNLKKIENAILVPNAAIQVDNIGHFVYVAKKVEGALYKISKVKVKLGQLYEDGNYLVEGLNKGDKVVVYGQLRVSEGALSYAATPQGVPIAEDGKPIADPVKIKEFLAKVTEQKVKLTLQAQKPNASAK